MVLLYTYKRICFSAEVCRVALHGLSGYITWQAIYMTTFTVNDRLTIHLALCGNYICTTSSTECYMHQILNACTNKACKPPHIQQLCHYEQVVWCYEASVTCKHSLKLGNSITQLLQIIMYYGQQETNTPTDAATGYILHMHCPVMGRTIGVGRCFIVRGPNVF